MFKNDRFTQLARSQSRCSRVVSVLVRGVAATVLVALGAGVAGGCSDSLECKPALPEGAVYRVTLLGETPKSEKCYVIQAMRMSPFQVTVGKTLPTTSQSDCSVTPANSAPQTMGVARIQSWTPSTSEMLGINCQISYESGCTGQMALYFEPVPGATINWTAPVIDGLVFRIEDASYSCLSSPSNCVDEYTARLERVQ
jgi:hypothetical protein